MRAAFYYGQRLVILNRMRRIVADVIAMCIRLCQGPTLSGATGSTSANVTPTLRHQGLSMLPGLVSGPAAADMATYFREKQVVTPRGESLHLSQLPLGTALAAYPLRTVLECPGIIDLINAPAVLSVVADYLGCKPTLSSLGVRWSFPNAGRAEATQAFHRDPDDWKFLKLFVYLTDVDACSGPHVFVLTSHLSNGRLRETPYSRPAIDARFGSDNVHMVVGPAGSAFLADTYGIHTGSVPVSTPRLILQAQYSLLPVFAFHYEPIFLPEPRSVDRYLNRLLFTIPQ